MPPPPPFSPPLKPPRVSRRAPEAIRRPRKPSLEENRVERGRRVRGRGAVCGFGPAAVAAARRDKESSSSGMPGAERGREAVESPREREKREREGWVVKNMGRERMEVSKAGER